MKSTKEIYNATASNWDRRDPVLLSDFTARPFVMTLCEPLKGKKVLDLGCGEGFCSRQFMQRGAASVYGIDISEKMIDHAKKQEDRNPLGIEYHAGDATKLDHLADESYDLIACVFLFNYLNNAQTRIVMKAIRRLLKPEGQFVFTIPHPLYAFLRNNAFPFYFDPKDKGYFSGRDITFKGEIWRRDGVPLHVQSVHKTLEDYFNALAESGFDRMPFIKELRVEEQHLEVDRAFFEPIFDMPLHVAFSLRK